MVVIVAGWAWSLPYQLRSSGSAASPIPGQEWEQLKADMSQSISRIKASMIVIRQEQAAEPDELPAVTLSPAATAQQRRELIADRTIGWTTYSNFDRGVSMQYPPEWQRTVADDGQTITFTNVDEVVTLQLNAPVTTPPAPAADTAVAPFFLDTLAATRFTPTDLTQPEQITAPWPDGQSAMVLTGRGEVFETMAFTFVLIQPAASAPQ